MAENVVPLIPPPPEDLISRGLLQSLSESTGVSVEDVRDEVLGGFDRSSLELDAEEQDTWRYCCAVVLDREGKVSEETQEGIKLLLRIERAHVALSGAVQHARTMDDPAIENLDRLADRVGDLSEALFRRVVKPDHAPGQLPWTMPVMLAELGIDSTEGDEEEGQDDG